MAIRDIPRSIEYKCDACGETETREHVMAHRFCPPGWIVLSAVNEHGDSAGGKLWCADCYGTTSLNFFPQRDNVCAK